MLVNLLMGFFAVMTVTERKADRPLPDALRPEPGRPVRLPAAHRRPRQAAQKQNMVPSGARPSLYLVAPFLSLFAAIAAFAVIPFGGQATIPGTDWTTCTSTSATRTSASCTSLRSARWGSTACSSGGWAAGSKYSLLGGLRAVAQLVSYEVAFTLSVHRRGHAGAARCR